MASLLHVSLFLRFFDSFRLCNLVGFIVDTESVPRDLWEVSIRGTGKHGRKQTHFNSIELMHKHNQRNIHSHNIEHSLVCV